MKKVQKQESCVYVAASKSLTHICGIIVEFIHNHSVEHGSLKHRLPRA